jgi:hypothetical protein
MSPVHESPEPQDSSVGTHPEPSSVATLPTLQREATERFARELDDVRAAMAASCEQAVGRLLDTRWVPLEAVTQLVDDLTAVATRERERAANLAAVLESTKRDAEAIREQSRAAVNAAQETAARERVEYVASLIRELDTARETATSAAASEAQLREELAAVRARCQDIVDAQTLQLTEFKRGLEQASAEACRARAEAEAAKKEASTRPAQVTALVKSRPQAKPGQNDSAPQFDAIEAVLAQSPPLGAKQTARL